MKFSILLAAVSIFSVPGFASPIEPVSANFRLVEFNEEQLELCPSVFALNPADWNKTEPDFLRDLYPTNEIQRVGSTDNSRTFAIAVPDFADTLTIRLTLKDSANLEWDESWQRGSTFDLCKKGQYQSGGRTN